MNVFSGWYGKKCPLRSLPLRLLTVRSMALFLFLGNAFFLTGCSGCRPDSQTAAEKKKEQEEKKEKAKKDFEFARLRALPEDDTETRHFVKPGHYVSCSQWMRSNNETFHAELVSASTDRNQVPWALGNKDFNLVSSRPVALPKGQAKSFESLYFIPEDTGAGNRRVWLNNKIRARNGGREVTATQEASSRMPHYQFFFLVLSDNPDSYAYMKRLDSVSPPSVTINETQIVYYRVVLPKSERRVPVASHPFAWTSVAYVLWDNLDPKSLTPLQQSALLDWLHWGGQLIISGPKSMDTLRGSFLAAFLPVETTQTKPLNQEHFDELNQHWSFTIQKADPTTGQEKVPEAHHLRVAAEQQLLGVGMTLAQNRSSQFVPHTGKLVAEARVGAGRIVMTAFPLATKNVINWKSFDNFFNNVLLRRPARQFVATERGENVQIFFSGTFAASHFRRDARLTTTQRYFTRDIGIGDPASDDRFGGYVERTGKGDEFAISGNSRGGAGVAGWNDRSGAALASRQALKDAAGISIPKAEFVLRILGIYLVVLVPMNWIVFRIIGRVEWAWVAAPLIAIIGAFAVVRLAQLDIGFVRSRNEVAILELQHGYSRAHLTRYSAFYTSLSTTYDLEFEDPSAVAQPFAASDRQAERKQNTDLKTVNYRRDQNIALRDFQVQSNTTEMIHSEQMFDVGGAFVLEGDDAEGLRLKNNTLLQLEGAGVLRGGINEAGKPSVELAWVGRLASQVSQPLAFQRSVEGRRARFSEWNDSEMTFSHRMQRDALFRRFDKAPEEAPTEGRGDAILTRAEIEAVDPSHSILVDFDRWDEDEDGQESLSRNEVMAWCRASRLGDISLGSLFDLVSERLTLAPGEVRLVGWTEQDLTGLDVSPDASQKQTKTMVLVHLRGKQLRPLVRDQQSKWAVIDPVDMATVGWVGIGADFRSQFFGGANQENLSYLQIIEVVEGSPADVAQPRLRSGDFLVSYRGQPINDTTQFDKMVEDTKPGSEVVIEFLRNDEKRKATLVVMPKTKDPYFDPDEY